MHNLSGSIRVDFRSPEPAYTQISQQIEALVRSGTLRPGDQLPTVRELAIDLRINFSTVARAYKLLDERRLISTQRGRGTYIEDPSNAQPPPEPTALDALARSTLEQAQQLGFDREDLIRALLTIPDYSRGPYEQT